MDALEVRALTSSVTPSAAPSRPRWPSITGQVDSVMLIGTAGLGDEINAGYTEGFVAAQSRRELKPLIEQLFADPTL